MLYTEAHREVLRLHVETGCVELLIAVARRVTDGEDDLPVLIPHRIIRKLRMEVNLTAERLDLITDAAHDIDETVRPDMRLRVDEDGGICPIADEQIQDETTAPIRILRQRVQLSVGECSSTTLTKLWIRVRLQLACRPETLDILDPLLDRRTALIHDRMHPGTREDQRCKHTGRTEAHDHRTVRLLPEVVTPRHVPDLLTKLRRTILDPLAHLDIPVPKPLHQLLLRPKTTLQLHQQRITEENLRPLPRIDRPPQHLQRRDLRRLHPQQLRTLKPQHLYRRRHRKLHLIHSDHKYSFI